MCDLERFSQIQSQLSMTSILHDKVLQFLNGQGICINLLHARDPLYLQGLLLVLLCEYYLRMQHCIKSVPWHYIDLHKILSFVDTDLQEHSLHMLLCLVQSMR